jgi:hypothetical protein
MSTNKIDYLSRDFKDYREDLINYIKLYYPDLVSDFSDASISTMLLNLNSAIGDNLSFNIDSAFNETRIDSANRRDSLLNIAKTRGLKIPFKTASYAVAEATISNIPVKNSSYDVSKVPLIKAGMKLNGFESFYDVDFAFNLAGWQC